MLGERRSKGAFYEGFDEGVREEKEALEPASVQLPEHDKGLPVEMLPEPGVYIGSQEREEEKEPETQSDEDDGYVPPKRTVRSLQTKDLFFSSGRENREFSDVLREVQGYLSKEYSSLVTDTGSEDAKSQIRRFAGKYIQDHRISVKGMSTDELINAIYSEMAEFGFLTKYIYGEGIEEIDVNAWDDVEVQFSGGVTRKRWMSILTARSMPSTWSGVCSMFRAWYSTMPAPASLDISVKTSELRYLKRLSWMRM